MVKHFIFIIVISAMFAALNVPLYGSFIFLFVYFCVLYGRDYYYFLWGKDYKKVEQYFLKHRSPFFRFFVHLLNKNYIEIELLLPKIKKVKSKNLAHLLFYLHRDDLERAKIWLNKIQNGETKQYYQACIALEEGNIEEFKTIKQRLKSVHFQLWLQVEWMFQKNQREEALELLNKQIHILRGVNLLSAVHYKEQLQNRMINKGMGT